MLTLILQTSIPRWSLVNQLELQRVLIAERFFDAKPETIGPIASYFLKFYKEKEHTEFQFPKN